MADVGFLDRLCLRVCLLIYYLATDGVRGPGRSSGAQQCVAAQFRCTRGALKPTRRGSLGADPARNVPQAKWEETYAWPPNNRPPYPPLAKRVLREIVSYVAVILILAALLQWFTPLPALSWLVRLVRMLTVG